MNQPNNNQNEQCNLLIEFEEKGYDLIQFETYHNFLIECSQKDYGDLFTQKHHILPKFMKGTNKIQNLIPLSCEDHYNSHVVLAHCFDVGTIERHKNLCSAKYVVANTKRLLRKKYGTDINFDGSDFWINANEEMRQLLSGDGNMMFGKKHSPETIALIIKNQTVLSGENHPCFGKVSPLKGRKIGPRGYKIKQPNRNQSGDKNSNFGKKRSAEWKLKQSQLIKERMDNSEVRNKLKQDRHGISILDNETKIIYKSITELCQSFNIRWKKYKQLVELGRFVIITKPRADEV